MGETTAISWTDHTFNPWIGCQRVSPGCEHCYAETLDKRVGGALVDGVKKLRWGPKAPRVRTSAANWKQPLKWNRKAAAEGVRRRVFCASMADVFEDRAELVPWRSDLFDLIQATPWLDWLLLTKRPENLPRMLPVWGGAFANVWLGTTVEDPLRCSRIADLKRVPAVVHFLSCEPLISELRGLDLAGIDWVIIGGESGGKARPFDVAWARSIVKQCRAAGVAPFVKQLGSNPFNGAEFRPIHLADRHGGDPAEWPLDLRVREFPEVRR